MSADTTGIILRTGGKRQEWRVAIVQHAEDLFDFEPSAAQKEAGREYAAGFPPGGPVDDSVAEVMAAKAAHVAYANSEGEVEAPGDLDRDFLEHYFQDATVFDSPEAARAQLEHLKKGLEAAGGSLEYGIVMYGTSEEFPTDLDT